MKAYFAPFVILCIEIGGLNAIVYVSPEKGSFIRKETI